MPSLTRPRSRQRAKNIYDPLPRRQEEPGRFFFLICGVQTKETSAPDADLTTRKQRSLTFQTCLPSEHVEEKGVDGDTARCGSSGGLAISEKRAGACLGLEFGFFLILRQQRTDGCLEMGKIFRRRTWLPALQAGRVCPRSILPSLPSPYACSLGIMEAEEGSEHTVPAALTFSPQNTRPQTPDTTQTRSIHSEGIAGLKPSENRLFSELFPSFQGDNSQGVCVSSAPRASSPEIPTALPLSTW